MTEPFIRPLLRLEGHMDNTEGLIIPPVRDVNQTQREDTLIATCCYSCCVRFYYHTTLWRCVPQSIYVYKAYDWTNRKMVT